MRYSEIVNELMGVKKFKDMTSDQVIKYLKSNFDSTNIKVLGSGHHGIAVKIGDSVYKMWMVDSAYEEYVKYCIANPQNPFLPKFLSKIKTMPAFFLRDASAPDVVHFVKMEVLKPIESIDEPFIYTINDPDEGRLFEEIDWNKMEHFFNYRMNKRRGTIINQFEDFISGAYDQDSIILSDELKYFLDTIQDIWLLGGFELDLEPKNFALRGSQLVILDPIYDQRSADLSGELADFNRTFLTNPSRVDAKPSMADREYRMSLKGKGNE